MFFNKDSKPISLDFIRKFFIDGLFEKKNLYDKDI